MNKPNGGRKIKGPKKAAGLGSSVGPRASHGLLLNLRQRRSLPVPLGLHQL